MHKRLSPSNGRHVKIRRWPGEEPGHNDGAAGSAERGDRGAGLEFSGELLHHKGGPSERRIERGGKTGARARRQQRPAVGGIAAKSFTEQVRESRAHLYARPLAAEREARTDRQQTANEFDRQQNQRGWRQLAVDDGLDVRNPAACGCLAEASHKPSAESRRRRRAHNQEAAADKRLAVPHDGQGNAETIGRFQRQPEKPAYKPSTRPGDAGEHGQREQAGSNENSRGRLNI